MRTTPIALTLPLLASLMATDLVAEEGNSSVSRVITYRQSLMNLFSWNLRPLRAMASDKRPFDEAAFRHHTAELATANRLDLLAGFPEDSEGEESSALPEIWFEWEGFVERHEGLREAISQLEQAAAGSDPEAMKQAADAVGSQCKKCHKRFKD